MVHPLVTAQCTMHNMQCSAVEITDTVLATTPDGFPTTLWRTGSHMQKQGQMQDTKCLEETDLSDSALLVFSWVIVFLQYSFSYTCKTKFLASITSTSSKNVFY